MLASFLSVFAVQIYYFWKYKNFESKADSLIEEKVDEVIGALKAEIPMADMFLRGSLDDKLRKKAKGLLANLLPALVKKSGSKADWVVVPWIIALVVAWLLSWA